MGRPLLTLPARAFGAERHAEDQAEKGDRSRDAGFGKHIQVGAVRIARSRRRAIELFVLRVRGVRHRICPGADAGQWMLVNDLAGNAPDLEALSSRALLIDFVESLGCR